MRRAALAVLVVCAATTCKEKPPPASESRALPATLHGGKLYVNNTGGHTVSVIDLGTRMVDREIDVGARPHGLAALPDESRLFVSSEAEHAVKIVDTRSDTVVGSIATTGVPNQVCVTPDARFLYVTIRNLGNVDVFDLARGERVKSLPVGQGPHNCYCPGSRQFMYVTAIEGRLVRRFDYAHDHVLSQTIYFDGEVRPIAVSRDEKRLFAALADLHGFAWADLATGNEVDRVARPLPTKRSSLSYLFTHGLELTPDQKELWVTSFIDHSLMVFDVTGAAPRFVQDVAVGDAPNWIAFSHDGRFVYSANAGGNTVSIVDVNARRQVVEIPVGQVPKRLLEIAPPK